ncbi:hypothetical protein MNBD_BACTEROID05-138 [hydrothermal vent metagenome]|uniref:Type II secretion system protein n=1 Tax=hydrothermal vent metagenome TaxID=652676 RepID=A0A3B0TMY7_9ZZZZ
MLSKKNKKQKGSILLEALLSVVVLSVGITVIIQAMTSSLRSTSYNGQYSQAMILLENQLFDLMQGTTSLESFDQMQRMSGFVTNYRYELAEKDIGESFDNVLSQVKADISWKSGQKNNQININTYRLNLPDEDNK